MSEQEIVERLILDSIQASITAIQCVTGSPENRSELKARIVYASSPITTGERMYELFRKYAVASVDELKRIDASLFSKEIMRPNLENGEVFAHILRGCGTYQYVICPATFFAKGWAQKHYITFWKLVIERFADDVRFNKSWQYSNGCVEEFLTGLKNRKMLYEDLDADKIIPEEAAQKIALAIEKIRSIGADASQLVGLYQEILKYI